MASSQIRFTNDTGSTGATVLKYTTALLSAFGAAEVSVNSCCLFPFRKHVLTALNIEFDVSEEWFGGRLGDAGDLSLDLALNVRNASLVIVVVVFVLGFGKLVVVQYFRIFVEKVA